MTENVILLFGIALSIAMTAFFAATETALISSDKIFLNKKRKEGLRSAQLALKLLEDIDYLLSTTQFGANLFIALSTTLTTIYLKRNWEQSYLVLFLTLGPIALIFSDSLPKVMGRLYSEKLSLLFSIPLFLISKLFGIFLFLITIYTQSVSRFLGLGKQDTLSRRKRAREELQALLSESDNESDIRLGHKRMIRKVLEFSQQNVKKVMLPLVNVDAIERESTVQEAIDLFESLRHSRLPVFEERIDNIVGILYFADVFQCIHPETEKVHRFMRTALFVPEMQQLETLTKEMRDSELAVVVDEYGGAVGIVTREDVLEEIVGDISDEWDENKLGVMEISPNTYLVQVNATIQEINEKLKIDVPRGEYETFAGFLLLQFNRIPTNGDELYFANFKVKVHRANARAIETVILSVQREKK